MRHLHMDYHAIFSEIYQELKPENASWKVAATFRN